MAEKLYQILPDGVALESAEFAARLDALPSIGAATRELYELPTRGNIHAEGSSDEPCIYLAGNSLGCLPKKARKLMNEELDVWGSRAVLGHFDHPHGRNWKDIDDHVTPMLAELVGAESPAEVACTSTLTSNLHNLFVSFFRPEGKRTKIFCEAKAFPSDQYAVQSHLDLHKLGPESLIAMEPREGEDTLRTKDILAIIEEQGDEIALVWFAGVQYYTGQVFEMEKIAAAGKAKGCTVGFDLAHAVGNVPLRLHDWGVDFAVWCSYKYLNAGPGAVAGLFVHSTHSASPPTSSPRPQLAGWWGHQRSTRFEMPPVFVPIEGAQSYQHSNPPLLSLIPLIASLETFRIAGGLPALRQRSLLLTGYLTGLLDASTFSRREGGAGFRILTPSREEERGAQLSLFVYGRGAGAMKRIFEGLVRRGVMGDEREPDVIRLAPIPLYTTFEDVRLTAKYLNEALEDEDRGRTGAGIQATETS